ncbi:hypothetical protein ACFS5L_20405 [Streptomyces phyllanthi]|uniref:Uncharacterized protein n=1 Tax=Streptomyces phyllanthi TaxID=1803180 RepID=A0A5N8W7L5_9ACTN|nr:hypothetical protein [Streptomyces phyllanthi]MPY43467.1 hypothetical protein [Streptomyces phyllanthi]
MTQSGQGEEPSARIPREGIVLPSDGSAPLLPGDQQPTPAPGRSWDEPWGPDQSAAPAPPPAQPWSAPEQPQAAAPAQEWGGQGWGTPQPESHAQAPSYPQPQPYDHQQPQVHAQPYFQPQYDAQQTHQPQQPQSYPQAQPMSASLPPEGAQPPSYGAPAYPGSEQAAPLPQAQPLPPQAGVLDVQTEGLPQQQPGPPAPVTPAAPLDEGATQYIPPVVSHPGDEGATQYIPPVVSHPGDEAATQYLPPVGPGALPPEASGIPGAPSDQTRRLGRVPGTGAGPMPAAAGAPVNPDAEATQYIAPVPPQQPDVFESLFRSEPGRGEGASATQQLPRVQDGYDPQSPYGATSYGTGGPGGPGGRASTRHDDGGGRARTGSRVRLIAAVGVGIAVLGVGTGALLSSGGGGDDQQDDSKTVAAAASSPAESPSADPAKEQAVELDKLLADSGDSRTAVINAVADIRRCDNLAKAATDLRNAAKQRNDLVTRLSGLSVDKLPDHAALTTALTEAWKASASADNHYAAWADQTAGKRGCRKGQARTTGQTVAGNRASTTASAEKTKAAKLWNSIASTYELTQRGPTQL